MQDNENEKKKVGFFGKIKNILFVDDETVDDKDTPILPDYKNRQEEQKEEYREVKEETPVIASRFNNTRREIEEEKIEEVKKDEIKEDIEIEEVKEEKESPFFSFDEDEFRRLTSRVARSEASNREKEKVETPVMKNNYTNTTTKYESRTSNLSSVNNTAHPGKKPFVPSPVISPVYGILDKNYSKEDIIDRRTERKPKEMDNLDRVRTKAFGNNRSVDVKEEKIEIKDRTIKEAEEEQEIEKIVSREEKKKNEIINNVEEIEDNIEIENPTLDDKVIDSIEDSYSSPIEEELNNMLNNNDDDELVDEEETNGIKKSAKLDDLEKTSTLKILDDIEKELNSIKPMNGDTSDDEDEDNKDSETVEKDIFDMISSMYEGGDEEDDND